jgi:hypothetical protein
MSIPEEESLVPRRPHIADTGDPQLTVKAADVALDEVAGKTRGLKPDGMLVATARRLGICLGD